MAIRTANGAQRATPEDVLNRHTGAGAGNVSTRVAVVGRRPKRLLSLRPRTCQVIGESLSTYEATRPKTAHVPDLSEVSVIFEHVSTEDATERIASHRMRESRLRAKQGFKPTTRHDRTTRTKRLASLGGERPLPCAHWFQPTTRHKRLASAACPRTPTPFGRFNRRDTNGSRRNGHAMNVQLMFEFQPTT